MTKNIDETFNNSSRTSQKNIKTENPQKIINTLSRRETEKKGECRDIIPSEEQLKKLNEIRKKLLTGEDFEEVEVYVKTKKLQENIEKMLLENISKM